MPTNYPELCLVCNEPKDGLYVCNDYCITTDWWQLAETWDRANYCSHCGGSGREPEVKVKDE